MKEFKKQKKFLDANLDELYTKFPYMINAEYAYLQNVPSLYKEKNWREIIMNEPLGGFRIEMGLEDMINKTAKEIEKVAERGYKKARRSFQPQLIACGFVFEEYFARDYASKRGDLQLSDYRGAISYTTKNDIITILKNGLDNGLGVGEVAKEIEKVSNRLFNRGRAEAIAVTELRKGYEYAHNKPIQDLQDAGIKMKKRRLTCRDAKVRPEHRECEAEGRVDLDYTYPSVGVDIPPGGVNCRCTIQYSMEKFINNPYAND